jgi:peptide/nickel transport system ATP-binding protein
VVAGLADRVAVMYAGRIVEEGDVASVIETPRHPYTQGLIGSVPSHGVRGARLAQIPGAAPSLANLPAGCAFAPRCARAVAQCRAERPDLARLGPLRAAACHLVAEDVS